MAGNGTWGYSGDRGAATAAQLNCPTAVAADGSGDLFIADSGNNLIRKVSLSSGVISTVAGQYSLAQATVATAVRLPRPSSTAPLPWR